MYIYFLDASLDKLLTNYEVLVSSPGISNTLTTNRDFETFKVRTVGTDCTVYFTYLINDDTIMIIMITLLSATGFIACL
jgi:ribosome maturation factor RimP